MRSAILLPADFEENRNKLIDILTVWKSTYSEYRKHYAVKDSESSLLWVWKATLDQMIESLQSDKTSVHCFLLLNEKDTLQAIAFCGESHKSEFHIYDFLAAPWNIKGRYFISTDIFLSKKIDNIEEQLIKFILHHCSSKNYSDIIYEPNHNWETDKNFFTKLQFKSSYRYISCIGLGINGYKINADILKEYYSSQFNKCVTFFSASTHVKLIENYPVEKNQTEANILKYNIL